MTSSTSPAHEGRESLRRGLHHALQEADPHRELDSIETVTAKAYLISKGIPTPAEHTPHTPRTIAGWLAWAARCSPAS